MPNKPAATMGQETAMRELSRAVTNYLNAVGASMPDSMRAVLAHGVNSGAVRLALGIMTSPLRVDVMVVAADGSGEPQIVHTSGVEPAMEVVD